MDTKICTYCEPPQEKPLSEFHKKSASKDGYSNRCKSCDARITREYRLRKGKKFKTTERTRQVNRKAKLKRNYKITPEDYDAMYAEQKGCCKICSDPYDALLVDHDHETGEVRGLLCANCNHGLGRFKDDPAILQNAVMYLTTSRLTRAMKNVVQTIEEAINERGNESTTEG